MRISDYGLLNTKERLTAYGILLLAFLVGLILPSPIFNRMAKVMEGQEDIELTDTINMILADGIYSGSIIRGSHIRQGYGRFEKSDGAVYEGDWEDDFLPYGKRTTQFSVYVGHFSTDYYNEGFGIINYSQKNILEKSKQGISDSEIVATYLGNWRKDMKEGLGRSIKKDGSMEFGYYRSGKFQPVTGANYRIGGSVYGFDASHYQKDIDWNNLALFCDKDGNVFNRANCETKYLQPIFFVYLKATEGATVKDDMYSIRVIEAERHGIVRGAYHFFRMSSDVDAQLKNFFETVTWTSNDMPPALDIEVEPEIEKYGAKKMQEMALEWLKRVEEKMGITPIIYTRENIRNKYLNDSRFRKYKFWIAKYSDKGPDNFDWQIWQKTESARMNGHEGNIDVNLFKGDHNAFMNYLTNINYKDEI